MKELRTIRSYNATDKKKIDVKNVDSKTFTSDFKDFAFPTSDSNTSLTLKFSIMQAIQY